MRLEHKNCRTESISRTLLSFHTSFLTHRAHLKHDITPLPRCFIHFAVGNHVALPLTVANIILNNEYQGGKYDSERPKH